MTFNTITNVIGGGVLNLPYAMHQASIVVASILCVISSAVSCFSVYTLVQACEYYQRFSMMDVWAFALFPQAKHHDMERATNRRKECLANDLEDEENDRFLEKEEQYAKYRDYMITFMIVVIFLYNFGCLVLYGVVIADSLPPVVQNFFHGSGIWVEKPTWLIAGGIVFFVLSCARKMDELMWSSILGFVTILYVVIMVVVRYFTIHADPSTLPDFDLPGHDDIVVADFNVGLASAMTSLGLAYCYHYNVPYYYKELKDRTPSKMMMTAVFSQPVTFICYVATGVFGYLTFGAAVANSHAEGNIVNNYADDDVAMNVGRFGLFFHFCCVYPILAVSCRRGVHHLLERYIILPYRRKQRERRLALLNNRRAVNGNSVDHGASTDDITVRASMRASQRRDTLRQSQGGRLSERQSRRYTLVRVSELETAVVSETPSLKLIAAEAFGIVSTSILCAWVAPGISIVVNVTGSLFGLFLMMVAPGIIGIRMYHLRMAEPYGFSKYIASWVLTIFGVLMIGSSFYDVVTGNS